LWSKQLKKGTFAKTGDEGKIQALKQRLMVGVYWRKDKQKNRFTDWICYNSNYEIALENPAKYDFCAH